MRKKLKDAEELEREIERQTGLAKTAGPSVTSRDIVEKTRRHLGPLWGKKNRPSF